MAILKLLTVIPGLNGSQSLLVLLNQISELDHQSTTVSGRQQFPGGILKSLAGGLDSDINVLLAGSIH
jgi:hypothetical protein